MADKKFSIVWSDARGFQEVLYDCERCAVLNRVTLPFNSDIRTAVGFKCNSLEDMEPTFEAHRIS